MSAGWDNFVASLDVEAVQRERFRVLGDLDAERPGSRQDHEMRFAHGYVRADFWRRMRQEGADAEAELERRLQRENAQREIQARAARVNAARRALEMELHKTDPGLDAAIREYKAGKQKAMRATHQTGAHAA